MAQRPRLKRSDFGFPGNIRNPPSGDPLATTTEVPNPDEPPFLPASVISTRIRLPSYNCSPLNMVVFAVHSMGMRLIDDLHRPANAVERAARWNALIAFFRIDL